MMSESAGEDRYLCYAIGCVGLENNIWQSFATCIAVFGNCEAVMRPHNEVSLEFLVTSDCHKIHRECPWEQNEKVAVASDFIKAIPTFS